MNIFKKLKWFCKYFNNTSTLGCRTSSDAMRYNIPDEDDRILFLKTFYVRCPYMPFCGESPTGKYYLLKNQWQAVYHIITCASLFKYHPFTFPKYIWWTIKDILYIKDDYEYYMNPTPVRTGRKLWRH